MSHAKKYRVLPLTFGTPVTGLWCRTCLLPSRYTTTVYAMGDDGLTPIGFVNRCDEHQA